MPSSLYGKLKLRLVDRLLAWSVPLNRVDTQATVAPSARLSGARIHGPVEIGERATIHRSEISGPVRIGRFSSLWGPEIYVHARVHPIEIGNFCSIARHVGVHGYYHDAERLSTHFIGRNLLGLPIEDEVVSRGPTRIGHDVWIGTGAQVLSGVSIGTGAIVGAGSVVSRDVPPYAVAVGAPARVVRTRFDEATVARLLASEWWTWSLDEIRSRPELFTRPVTGDLLDAHL